MCNLITGGEWIRRWCIVVTTYALVGCSEAQVQPSVPERAPMLEWGMDDLDGVEICSISWELRTGFAYTPEGVDDAIANRRSHLTCMTTSDATVVTTVVARISHLPWRLKETPNAGDYRTRFRFLHEGEVKHVMYVTPFGATQVDKSGSTWLAEPMRHWVTWVADCVRDAAVSVEPYAK